MCKIRENIRILEREVESLKHVLQKIQIDNELLKSLTPLPEHQLIETAPNYWPGPDNRRQDLIKDNYFLHSTIANGKYEVWVKRAS